jgi:hypothetical protein
MLNTNSGVDPANSRQFPGQFNAGQLQGTGNACTLTFLQSWCSFAAVTVLLWHRSVVGLKISLCSAGMPGLQSNFNMQNALQGGR